MSLVQTVGIILLVLILYAVLLVSCENKIIYHPYKFPEGFWDPAVFGVQAEDLFFEAEDGVRLHGWFIPAKQPVATMLWFHGNAGNITHRLENIRQLEPLNLNIFIFDYRGFGKSEGHPEEAGLYLDSQAAYDALMRSKKIAPETLFLFGRSLGGVCALEVAARHPVAGVILESVFTSAQDMAKTIFPILPLGWAIESRFDARKRVAELEIPKLFLHGSRDEIVPYRLGRKLYEAAAEPKEFYEIQGAGHNDTFIVGGQPYFDRLHRFIRDHAPPPKREKG